jgi:hypothetical protein
MVCKLLPLCGLSSSKKVPCFLPKAAVRDFPEDESATKEHSAASRNQRRIGRKGTQGSQKNKRHKLLSMCSLFFRGNSFVKNAELFRIALQGSQKEQTT